MQQYWDINDRRVRLVISHVLDLEKFQNRFATLEDVWFINWAPIPEQAQAIVDAFLDLEVIYPGMEGDISVYRKPRPPPPAAVN